jgi:SHS2 domain-containing protein
MFDIITDNSEVESVGQYEIKLAAADLEQLVVDWLSELLFLHGSQNLVFGFFNVKLDLERNQLIAQVFGEPFSQSKHKSGVEIKAVTHHMVKVQRKRPYTVQILFDI